MMAFRVLVTGGRAYADQATVYKVLDGIFAAHGSIVVIQGGAGGADMLAQRWAADRAQEVETYRPEYKKHPPKIAPLIRNTFMVEECSPDMCVAFPGGNGTADCLRKAKAKGIATIEVSV